MIRSFLQWFECYFLSQTHVKSVQFFPTSPLVALCKRQSWRASPHLIHTQPWWVALRWNGEVGERVEWSGSIAAFGNKTWLMLWLEHSRRFFKDKNKRDSDSAVAGCLGTDSPGLHCRDDGSAIIAIAPGTGLMSICGRTVPWSPRLVVLRPPGWKLISSCYQKAVHPNSGVLTPDLNLDHFPFSCFCFWGPVPFFCTLNGLTPHFLRRMRV